MPTKTYVLPRAVLTRVLKRLDEIANLAVRSAANDLMHLVGRYHAAPETYGRHFFLCRTALVDHPEMVGHSEWRIRLAIKAILELGIIYEADLPAKARYLGEGRFRRPPRYFRLNRHLAKLFPAARPRREYSPFSPEYSSSHTKIINDRSEASRVYSGEKNIRSTGHKPQEGRLEPREVTKVLAQPHTAGARPEPNTEKHTPRVVAVDDLSEFDFRMMALNIACERISAARIAEPVEPGKLRVVTADEAIVPPEPPPRPADPAASVAPELSSRSDGDWIAQIMADRGVKLPPRNPGSG